jgi:hypothetical protein
MLLARWLRSLPTSDRWDEGVIIKSGDGLPPIRRRFYPLPFWEGGCCVEPRVAMVAHPACPYLWCLVCVVHLPVALLDGYEVVMNLPPPDVDDLVN